MCPGQHFFDFRFDQNEAADPDTGHQLDEGQRIGGKENLQKGKIYGGHLHSKYQDYQNDQCDIRKKPGFKDGVSE